MEKVFWYYWNETKYSKKTGIPTTRGGMERKLGSFIIKLLFKK